MCHPTPHCSDGWQGKHVGTAVLVYTTFVTLPHKTLYKEKLLVHTHVSHVRMSNYVLRVIMSIKDTNYNLCFFGMTC